MNIEEYRIRKDKIQEEARTKSKELSVEYAMSNNPVKIGDIISNAVDTIVVEKIQATNSFMSDRPSCVYAGPKITKAGKPFKNGEYANVYQTGMVLK